jgi:hypothetical protein
VLVLGRGLVDSAEDEAKKPLELRRGVAVLRLLTDEDVGQFERVARLLSEVVLFPRVRSMSVRASAAASPLCFRYFNFCAVEADRPIK